MRQIVAIRRMTLSARIARKKARFLSATEKISAFEYGASAVAESSPISTPQNGEDAMTMVALYSGLF